MRLWHGVVGFVGAVLLSACGGAAAGESCSGTGFLCDSKSTALECRQDTRKWTALPCRGPAGCAVSNDKVTCDQSLDQEGDACAAKDEASGICAHAGTALLVCRDGKFVKTQDCTTCTADSSGLHCM
jgi:hypothetical protein